MSETVVFEMLKFGVPVLLTSLTLLFGFMKYLDRKFEAINTIVSDLSSKLIEIASKGVTTDTCAVNSRRMEDKIAIAKDEIYEEVAAVEFRGIERTEAVAKRVEVLERKI